jgi:hypothetical protein
MFIDEVYSLSNSNDSNKDIYSKECIDTITQNLSENRNFICIIAGYKEQVEKCFFAQNEGLNRRFAFRYHINDYSADELRQIFALKVSNSEYKLFTDIEVKTNDDSTIDIKEIFATNHKYFKNGGGDMETLFMNVKIVHSRNITHTINTKYILTLQDIKMGIEMLTVNRDVKDENTRYLSMYI